jgi:hypothetical protein
MNRLPFPAIALASLALLTAAAAPTPSTPTNPSISLTDPQRLKLVALIQSDPEAAKLFDRVRRAADAALADEPHPIESIQTEGKLKTDPVKVKTTESLADMSRLDALGYAWAVTADAKYAAKTRQFILAWAKVNRSAGDPIDDTALEPLIVAYDLTRPTFPPAERDAADAYLRQVATKELETGKRTGNNKYNNWHSHRLKVVGLIAFVLRDRALIDQTAAAFREQVDKNLHPDGSSFDFHERDALHYHIYDLTPLLTLAIAARNNGIDLYAHRSPSGASLAKSIEFLLPYAQGTKQHAEFVNSKVAFDRKRAESGDKHYQAGTPFEPKEALPALERDELFDPSLLPLVTKLAGGKAEHYPTWQVLLNAARRQPAASTRGE